MHGTHSKPISTAPVERLHALDNLRAVMMWLGVVLHVAVIYIVMPSPLPWRDTARSEWADLAVAWIHSFRMPVFFILAGFFVRLLLQRRGARGMLAHRLTRLGLPFLLFWPVLLGVCSVLALLFVHRMVWGTWGLDTSLIPPRPGLPTVNTLHLWFLWMLIWFCVGSAVLAPLQRWVPAAVQRVGAKALSNLSGVRGALVLACPLVALGAAYPEDLVMASGAFLPPLAEWIFNGLFFGYGLALYGQRQELLARFRQQWRVYAAVGLGCFLVSLLLSTLLRAQAQPAAWMRFGFSGAYHACAWLWSFAWIGAFLRYGDRAQAWLAYLAQSAYWVYLVHLPATIGFGALLLEAPLPALVKMALNIVASTLVSLWSYHVLVRSTAVGQLLNGCRYPYRPLGVWLRSAGR